MLPKSVHVFACADGWAVEEDGAQVSVRHTRAQAEQIARAFATGRHAELIVHSRDGGVERKNSYENDPTSGRG
jgi:hypothetical protein